MYLRNNKRQRFESSENYLLIPSVEKGFFLPKLFSTMTLIIGITSCILALTLTDIIINHFFSSISIISLISYLKT